MKKDARLDQVMLSSKVIEAFSIRLHYILNYVYIKKEQRLNMMKSRQLLTVEDGGYCCNSCMTNLMTSLMNRDVTMTHYRM